MYLVHLQSIQNLRDGPSFYRELVRRDQLGNMLRREAHLAMKSKARNRRFTLGLIGLEHDEEILGLRMKKVVYDYKSYTIANLDSLLGKEWDVLQSSVSVTQFVTQLSLWTKDGCLSGSVRTAVCREVLSADDYRGQLQAHIRQDIVDHELDDENQVNTAVSP